MKLSKKSYKLTFAGSYTNPNPDEEANPVSTAAALIQVELHEVEKDEKYLVAFTRLSGSSLAFKEQFTKIQQNFVKESKLDE